MQCVSLIKASLTCKWIEDGLMALSVSVLRTGSRIQRVQIVWLRLQLPRIPPGLLRRWLPLWGSSVPVGGSRGCDGCRGSSNASGAIKPAPQTTGIVAIGRYYNWKLFHPPTQKSLALSRVTTSMINMELKLLQCCWKSTVLHRFSLTKSVHYCIQITHLKH